VLTKTDLTVWTISAVLAIAIGWSRYAKIKTREKLVRELAAMTRTAAKKCSTASIQKPRPSCVSS
jgi:hypothetical protein